MTRSQTGERNAGNLHTTFEVAGSGNRFTVRLVSPIPEETGSTRYAGPTQHGARPRPYNPHPKHGMVFESQLMLPTRPSAVPKRKDQAGGFGALQPPATISWIDKAGTRIPAFFVRPPSACSASHFSIRQRYWLRADFRVLVRQGQAREGSLHTLRSASKPENAAAASLSSNTRTASPRKSSSPVAAAAISPTFIASRKTSFPPTRTSPNPRWRVTRPPISSPWSKNTASPTAKKH